ncbi:MAG: hypothetical protein CVV27_12180 [Candidatus Melainabacteria bacterium HGW-Melainabacteria-1]|nr:MAG: hypothetical protein CVV27_12180 [Candidatus Melainabacteria bacterium HGW-Melainabacteria-1]
MDSIRFQASNQPPLRPEVLNHRTASPLTKNQIQFHIGSAYLRDFTPEGIERFISQNQPKGKDLSSDEVKTFIQRVAANAESAKNVSFDLADPQLGLFEDDGIAKRHLDGAFTLSVSDKAVLPAGQARNIRFVDVTSASYDLKQKETEISGHQRTIRGLQTQLKDLREKQEDTTDDRSTARRILGPDADSRLSQNVERRDQIAHEQSQLLDDEKGYRTELGQPDIKPERKRELERILRALPAEKSRLDTEHKKLLEAYEDTTGPLLQRYSLKELHQLNQAHSRQADQIKQLESQIQEQLGKIRAVVDRPAEASGTQPNPITEQTGDGPGETPATTPATQADGPPATQPDPETVTVGAGIDLAELRTQPPSHQASRLASLPAEQQRAVIAQLNPEERGKLLEATEVFIERLSSTQSSRTQKQLENYKGLQQELKRQPDSPPSPTADAPAETSAEATAPAPNPPANQPVTPPTTGAAPASATAASSTVSSDITLGTSQTNAPAGTLTSGGKPMLYQGTALTLSSFANLSVQAKFNVLMECDEKHVRELLTSMKSQRGEIYSLAKKVVDDYNASLRASVAANPTAQGATRTVETHPVQAIYHTSVEPPQVVRAKLIMRIIEELDGLPSSETTAPPQTAAPTAATGKRALAAGEYYYTVKPGDTPDKIAENEMGNKMFVYDLFDRNEGLNEAMTRRNQGRDFNRHDEDLAPYQEYQQLILSRTPRDPSPVERSKTAPTPQLHPTVEDLPAGTANPPATQPVTQPATQPAQTAPVPPAEQPKSSPTVEDLPVDPPPAASQPNPAPAAQTAPTTPAVQAQSSPTVEDLPVDPAPAATQPAATQPPAPPRKTS